jgi:hypothetical protein
MNDAIRITREKEARKNLESVIIDGMMGLVTKKNLIIFIILAN